MSFPAREFRNALGLFPTGVAVVTATSAEGEVVGVTVNSFTSVSLNPPLVLVSLARSLRSFEVFRAASAFAVNLLREDQKQISGHFARRQVDKWQGVEHRLGAVSCPILYPNLAAFECVMHAQYDGGDHLLLLGRVLRFERDLELAARPLVYFRGQYRAVSDDGQEAVPFPLGGW